MWLKHKAEYCERLADDFHQSVVADLWQIYHKKLFFFSREYFYELRVYGLCRRSKKHSTHSVL